MLTSFNRTSMESKQRAVDGCESNISLLIEPVWNRNEISVPSGMYISPPLLIEPVWNRNLSWIYRYATLILSFNRTSMESKHMLQRAVRHAPALLIEPVWNRNLSTECPRSSGSSFNRTSMESKHVGTLGVYSTPGILLIEPVWNRNQRLKVEFGVSRVMLLIEPVWNRNDTLPIIRPLF